MRNWPHQRYMLRLGAVFLLVWGALAIRPYSRADWVLENLLVVPGVLVVALSSRRLPLSRISYTLIFVFLCLHSIGAHHTYAKVPYDSLLQALTGRTGAELFGWERNHFDRLVHFCFGLLLAYPIRELFVRVAQARGMWGYYLPLEVTMACAMIFELLEWLVAVVFGGDLGVAYLGTQGDPWDAQKDMALATLGGAIAMAITAAVNARLQRDFAQEWVESVRVKIRRPLGEDEIERMRKRSKP